MTNKTIDDLERELRSTEYDPLGTERLADIRREGRRRRTTRRALVGVGGIAAAGVLVLGLGLAGVGDGPDRGTDLPVADAPPVRPTGLSPLAERALREIPGAEKVSAWQVVIPGPGAQHWMAQKIKADDITTDPVSLGTSTFAGVTSWTRSAFPAWLYDGSTDSDEAGASEEGVAVGTTSSGIVVDSGDAYLACVSYQGNPCRTTYLSRVGGDYYLEFYISGADGFLEAGADMQVFETTDSAPGDAPSLSIAGLPGTDVARVEFVNTRGVVTAGAVSHDVMDGASLMWGNSQGSLARVIAYDAEGDVIEDHALRECEGGVDCEVR